MSRRGRKPASPELAELVDKAVTDQILDDNVEENAGQMEEWNMGTPLPPGIVVAYRPVGSLGETQFKCTVYASNSRHNSNRCIYRGSLFQCKLAHDLWLLATEKYRKHKIGEKHPLKSRAPYFYLKEDFAQNALNHSVDVQGYFIMLVDLFLREGWLVAYQPGDTEARQAEHRQESRERVYGKSMPVRETLEALCAKIHLMCQDNRVILDRLTAIEVLLRSPRAVEVERAVPIPLAPYVVPDPLPTLLSPQQAADLADAVIKETPKESL